MTENEDFEQKILDLLQEDTLTFEDFKELIENRDDEVDLSGEFGQRVLMEAIDLGNEEIVQYLVERGADVNSEDMFEMTENEDFEQKILDLLQEDTLTFEDFKALIENRDDEVDLSGEFGQRVLMGAADLGNKDIVRYVVEHGADVNAKDRNGNTPLMNAVIWENEEVVRYLVEHGADVNAKNTFGMTVLKCALQSEDKEIFKYLAEHGADVNAKDEKGKTLLMDVASKGNKEIFEYLVEHGADVNAQDNEGARVEKYYSGELLQKYREGQKKAYDGNAWKDIQRHTVSSTYGPDSDYGGYTTNGGDISVGIEKRVWDVSPEDVFRAQQRMSKNSTERVELKEKWHVELMSHPFDRMMIFVHEGNHRLHMILDGMGDGNYTAEQNVKINYCTEAVAHTSQCLAAALQYQKMKEAGIKVYQYVDNKGQIKEIPLEDLLEQYSPKLKEYVTKNGFNPNNVKDVDEVTEIGLQYWKTREQYYAGKGRQFDEYAKPLGTGEGVSKEEFNSLIMLMCDGVVIGDGVELDLRRFADKFNGMSDAEALVHKSRAEGKPISIEEAEAQVSKENAENRENLTVKLKEQKGEEVAPVQANKAKEMRLSMRVDNRALAQHETEKPVEKQSAKDCQVTGVALSMMYNEGRT